MGMAARPAKLLAPSSRSARVLVKGSWRSPLTLDHLNKFRRAYMYLASN